MIPTFSRKNLVYRGSSPLNVSFSCKILKPVEFIKSDLKNHPKDSKSQLNLAGYSYGSVLLANVALVPSDEGIIIDNLVLIGSPISDKSELYNTLNNNENICTVIRHDIKNDSLSNPQSSEEYLEDGLDNSSDDGHHFDKSIDYSNFSFFYRLGK